MKRTNGTVTGFRIIAFAALSAAVLFLSIGDPPDALAGHDLGKQCYVCHNIQSGQV